MVAKRDLTGQKYGRLTFIKPTEERYSGRVIWEAICECKTILRVKPGNVLSGNTTSCGCLHTEKSRINIIRAHEINRLYEPRISIAVEIWKQTYNEECDFELFLEKTQQNCYYCGIAPFRKRFGKTRKGKTRNQNNYFIYNGLDRVDRLMTHNNDNIVPACFECNKIKWDSPQSEFYSMIGLIYQFSIENSRHYNKQQEQDRYNHLINIINTAIIKGKGRQFPAVIANARQVWCSSTYRKKIEFDSFLKMSQCNCYYCGRAPYKKFSKRDTQEYIDNPFIYNGIDRLDSSKTYLSNNIVPCCRNCNIAKMALSINDFWTKSK